MKKKSQNKRRGQVVIQRNEALEIGTAVRTIKTAILKSRYMAARKANFEHLKLYFNIGAYVSANTRNGTWGTGAIEAISERLSLELPGLRGFSPSNIKNMRQFFEEWAVSSNRQLATGDLMKSLSDDAVPAIRQLPTGELTESDLAAFFSIGFTHHMEILFKCRSQVERWYYIRKAAMEFWKVEELKRRRDLPHIGGRAARLQGPQAVAGWVAETSGRNERRGRGQAQRKGASQMKLRRFTSAPACNRLSWTACLLAGLLCVAIMGSCFAVVSCPKLYAAHGTFYYWFYGLEKTAGYAEWSGPDPLWCFKVDLWDKRPDDFEQRVMRRLRTSYGMDANKELKVKDAIQSIVCGPAGISFTWAKLIVLSSDPVLAADVANGSMEVLHELDLEQHGGVLTNTMFKIMARAEVPTNTVPAEVAQRLQKRREKWCRH